MSTQIAFPRLNVVVADEATAAPIEGASVKVDVDGEMDEKETVVNKLWEGVASFKIAPTYNSVEVTVSHDLFEQEVTEVEIDDNVTTEVFELSTRTGNLTISPLKTVETDLDMEIRPTDRRIQSIWDVEVCEMTVFPDSDETISLPHGEYLLEVARVDGEQLVTEPSRRFTVEPELPTTIDFQAPSVTSLPDPQMDQMQEISHRIDEFYNTKKTIEGEVDFAIPNYLFSTAGELVEGLEARLDHGLPKRFRGVSIEEITVTYLEALSQVLDDIHTPVFDENAKDLFRVASKLEPVDAQWNGRASFEELREHLNKSPSQAVDDFEAIRTRVDAALEEAESELEHPEVLRDVFTRLEIPETDDSVELTTHFFVVSRFWLALEDILQHDELRARLDVTAGPDKLEDLEDPDAFKDSDDESGDGFFNRF